MREQGQLLNGKEILLEREADLMLREAGTYDVRIVRQGGERAPIAPIAPGLSDYAEEKRSWRGMQRHEV